MDPELPTYNMPWLVELTGLLDVDALRAALAAALSRHEALRTTLREVDGEPVQVVAAEASLAWRLTDLSSALEPDEAARERTERLARQPFDLRQGPLLRAELLRLGPQRHQLVVVCHRVVGDGRSVGILLEQLVDDYVGKPVPAPPIQYPDFAAWQADRAAAWRGAEEFWRSTLAGAPTTVELAGVRPRRPRPSHRGAVAEFVVPSSVVGPLREVARSRGTTLFPVLLAGYAATVGRLAGRTDLLVGVPVAGREPAETERVVGLFVNTLALRLRPRRDASFVAFVAEVAATLAAASAHQELPFDRVVEVCQVPPDATRSALVQVMFQRAESLAPVRTDGLRWVPRILDNGGATVDLSLTVSEIDDGSVRGALTYATDLYDAPWAGRFVDCLLTLLGRVSGQPTAPLGAVDILSSRERARVAGDFATGANLPDGPGTAIGLLSGVAGDEPARIAGSLRALGVGPESRVGICLPRDERLVSAVLGVWWAGAAYVPLDPAFPPARLAAMVADSGLRIVLGSGPFADSEGASQRGTSEERTERAGEPGWQCEGAGVTSVGYADALRGEPVPCVDLPAQAAAYTIFTSGSTGRPKGVTVSQGNVAALLRAFRALLPLGPDDHLVAVTTLSFDISVLELLLPGLCGARVTVADAETAMDPNALRRLLRETGATAMQATPATWRALAISGGVPETVRLRLCGGEALPRDLAVELVGDGAQLWNVYGPTETTVWSAAGRVEPSEPVRVGPPIPGTRMYVLDGALCPVPIGVTGEVFLGGAGVARGYHDKPGLTAERFVPDPFSANGERLYATGDLGRWCPDGRVELLGRADHQVKLRGFRIEIEEIEAMLRSSPGVSDAAVALVSDPDPRLVAYVVGSAEGLAGRLAGALPEYMVPALFQELDHLPRTPNGKLDRSALPAPRIQAQTPSRGPSTPTEEGLVPIWQELLRLEQPPGADDNFFVLGGHSLTAITLLARVRDELGVEVPLRELFNHPTIAGLAELVETIRAEGGSVAPRPPAGLSGDDPDDEELEALLRELLA